MSQNTGAEFSEWSRQMSEFKKKLRLPMTVQPMLRSVPRLRARH